MKANKTVISYIINGIQAIIILLLAAFTGDPSGALTNVRFETETKVCYVDFGMKEGILNLIKNTNKNHFKETVSLEFNCEPKNSDGLVPTPETKSDVGPTKKVNEAVKPAKEEIIAPKTKESIESVKNKEKPDDDVGESDVKKIIEETKKEIDKKDL